MDYFSNSKLANRTRETYNAYIKKFCDIFDKKILPHQIYNNPYESIQTLRHYLQQNNNDTINILHRYVSTILSYRKYNSDFCSDDKNIYEAWKNILDLSYVEISKHLKENKPSRTQELKDGIELTSYDLQKIRDELPMSLTKLLIAFYTMIPPMRADYGMVQLIGFDDNPITANYIKMDDSTAFMRITDFKTASTYKEVSQKLPDDLFKLLKESLKLIPRDYLFVNKFNSPFTRQNFINWANDKLSMTLGKTFTLTMFRHIYLSSLPKNITVQERDRISKLMGHSLETQLSYEWV